MDFRDRHVVVTGGTGALGTAVVAALTDAGAVCHVPYVVAAEAERFALRTHANVKLVEAGNLADEGDVTRLYSSVSTLWGSIHIAGGFAAGDIVGTRRADLMGQIEMNFVTAYLCCGAAISAMSRAGVGGRIVNVSARAGLEWRGGAGMVAYAASKAAVAAMTVALAEEAVKLGILVNAVAPSVMDTPANRASMPKADHAAWPKVEEVAATILFLASPGNKVTRGAVVPVYGRS